MQMEVMVEMTCAEDANSLKLKRYRIQYVQYAAFFPLYSPAARHFQCSMEEEERKITLTTQVWSRTDHKAIYNKAVLAVQ